MEKERGSFTGNLGFIMAAAGAAVGLGNIWKFPYLAGSSGGGLFILIYLILLVVMGIPAMLSETTLGRRGGGDAMRSTIRVAEEYGSGQPRAWGIVGFLGVLGCLLIYTYYPIVGGWVLDYLVMSLTTPLSEMTHETVGTVIGNWPVSLFYSVIFYAATFVIVVKGVAGGIEKAARILMPALFIILLVIVVRSVTLPGAVEGLKFFWVPNLDSMRAAGGFGKVALAALGQLFFSLSIGHGIMITYGSYLKKDTNLQRNAVIVPFMDCMVAFLSGMAIMPAVFAFGMEPGQGPGLIFATLPQVFNHFGPFVGPLFMFMFFVLVIFATITSTISILEVISAFLIDSFGWTRRNAALAMSLFGVVVGTANILSLSVFSDFTIGGEVLFDALNWGVDKLLIPSCSFLVCIFVGYVWKPENAYIEITNEGTLPFRLFKVWRFLIKYVIPVFILAIMVSGLIGV